jgi:hypothetical protein
MTTLALAARRPHAHQLLMRTTVALVLLVLVTRWVSSAEATLVLEFSNGSTTTTIYDGGPGDASPEQGRITFAGTVGAYSVNVFAVDFPDSGSLASGAYSIQGPLASSLTMKASDVGFIDPTTGDPPSIRSAFSVHFMNSGLAAAGFYLDSTNALFGTATLLAALGPCSSSCGGFTDVRLTEHLLEAYSLTQTMTFSGDLPLLGGGGSVNALGFSTLQQAVPEPSRLLLIASGIVAVALSRRAHLVRLAFRRWFRANGFDF